MTRRISLTHLLSVIFLLAHTTIFSENPQHIFSFVYFFSAELQSIFLMLGRILQHICSENNLLCFHASHKRLQIMTQHLNDDTRILTGVYRKSCKK